MIPCRFPTQHTGVITVSGKNRMAFPLHKGADHSSQAAYPIMCPDSAWKGGSLRVGIWTFLLSECGNHVDKAAVVLDAPLGPARFLFLLFLFVNLE